MEVLCYRFALFETANGSAFGIMHNLSNDFSK